MPEIIRLFHARHETLFAHHDETQKTVITNLKIAAFGTVAKVGNKKIVRSDKHPSKFQKSIREVWFDETGMGIQFHWETEYTVFYILI